MKQPTKFLRPRSARWVGSCGLLAAAFTTTAANLDPAVNLPNLVFVGRTTPPNLSAVEVVPLSFTGRQSAPLPPVMVSALHFSGRGDPGRIAPVTSPSLNFKGKLPQ